MGLKIKVVALWVMTLHLAIAAAYLVSEYRKGELGFFMGAIWIVLLIAAIEPIHDNWKEIESWHNNRQKKNPTAAPPKGDWK